MTIEEMRIRKIQLHLTNAQISQQSGVPVSTVQKVLGGSTASPRPQTLQALEKVLKKQEKKNSLFSSPPADVLQDSSHYSTTEKSADRKNDLRRLTIADRDALPGYIGSDLPNTELIDGVIYDMGSPRTIHQIITVEIYAQIRTWLQGKKGSCLPFINPTDVVLDDDNDTVLIPDLFVVCDRSKIREDRIYGAPDLVMEVLSPSTKKKDQTIKFTKYFNAGVREYWLIDPVKKTVLVYNMDAMREMAATGASEVTIYGFEDRIPVMIWNGDFSVDMNRIAAYLGEIGLEQ